MNLCNAPTGINMQKPAMKMKMSVPTGISMQCCMNCELYRHQHAMQANVRYCVADLHAYNMIEVFLWSKRLSVVTHDQKRNIKRN